MNPGSNLFLRAIRLIKPTKITYLKYKGRTQNQARNFVPEFDAPIELTASVQAVNRSAYTNLGLDFQKNYIKIYVTANLLGVERDSSGDRFQFNGKLYQIDNGNNWFVQDGWSSCIAVEIDIVEAP